MKKDSYHHKNLKNDLIENGIKMVSSKGVEGFSLRKLALLCSVSPAAPYSHFKSKEELIFAMQEYITDKFSDALEETISKYNGKSDCIERLGKEYFSFFYNHPQYFNFLFSKSGVRINLSLENTKEDFYKPFEIYKECMISQLKKNKYPEEKMQDIIISVWAFVHGLTALATSDNTVCNFNWEEKITDFINALKF